MQSFDILRKSEPIESFRVNALLSRYDMNLTHCQERFTGSFAFPEKWNIGLIVGRSGTGKTTIANDFFGSENIFKNEYKAKSVIDDMPKDCTIEQITSAFTSVGFSSAPSWLKPYSVLSNGEKMRVDLAFCILSNKALFLFDEFTSVVDREVAKVTSFSCQKAIRRNDKKMIAIACHFDIVDWLLPDWIFNTDTMTFQSFEGQKKNRPDIKLSIYENGEKEVWNIFRKYHYLSDSHNKAAKIYTLTMNDNAVGFISVIHFPHSKVKNFKKVHRLVILPDYQGLGLGKILLNYVAKLYKNKGFRFRIVTASIPLINSLKRDIKWAMCAFAKPSARSNTSTSQVNISTNTDRYSASFEYK